MRLLASTTMSVAASLFGPPSTARLGRDVEIRQAAGGRGRGAFATRTLPAGEYLGRYTGRLMSPTEAYCAYEAGVTTGEYFASLGEAGDGEALQHGQSALAHSTVKVPWLTARSKCPGSQRLTQPPTTPEAPPFAQGCPQAPTKRPSPLGCRREPALALC